VKMPAIGDIVRHQGQYTTVIDRPIINQTVHYALKGKDGVNTAVPSQYVEWNGKQFIVNPNKLK
jgi:hypothetical protein